MRKLRRRRENNGRWLHPGIGWIGVGHHQSPIISTIYKEQKHYKVIVYVTTVLSLALVSWSCHASKGPEAPEL